jgi:hypothetical protein
MSIYVAPTLKGEWLKLLGFDPRPEVRVEMAQDSHRLQQTVLKDATAIAKINYASIFLEACNLSSQPSHYSELYNTRRCKIVYK